MERIKHLGINERIELGAINTGNADNDFYIYNVEKRALLDYPFKIDEYSCYVCLEGKAGGTIDLLPFCLSPSSIAVNVPGQLLEQKWMSDDFRAIGVTMSHGFVRSLGLPYNFQLDRMLRDAPVVQLSVQQMDAILSYCTMVKRLLEHKRPFQMETLRHLTCAFFYGIGSYIYQLSEGRSYSAEESVMRKFIDELKANYRRQRKVTFYADRLNVSPGYLSTTVKNTSGRTPGEWIDDYVIEEARALLKGTELTVQQISYELGFPTQSFFGKFFKRVTGMAPREYRGR